MIFIVICIDCHACMNRFNKYRYYLFIKIKIFYMYLLPYISMKLDEQSMQDVLYVIYLELPLSTRTRLLRTYGTHEVISFSMLSEDDFRCSLQTTRAVVS